MAVYRFSATMHEHEDNEESGTVVAHNKQEALEKLKQYKYDDVRLRKIGGVKGFLKSFTADVK